MRNGRISRSPMSGANGVSVDHAGPFAGAALLDRAGTRRADGSGRVRERAAAAFVEVVERHRRAIAHERIGRPRERRRVPHDVRDAHLVQPAAIGRVRGARVVLLGPQHDVRIGVRIGRDASGAVGSIAGGAGGGRCVEHAVDVDGHRTGVRAAGDRDVMPRPVGDAGGPDDGLGRRAHGNPECDALVAERNAEIAVVASAEDVAIDDDVAVDPCIGVAGGDGAGVLPGRRLEPELDREIAADVHRAARATVGERDLHPVDVPGAGPEEAQRVSGGGRVRHGAGDRGRHEHPKD